MTEKGKKQTTKPTAAPKAAPKKPQTFEGRLKEIFKKSPTLARAPSLLIKLSNIILKIYQELDSKFGAITAGISKITENSKEKNKKAAKNLTSIKNGLIKLRKRGKLPTIKDLNKVNTIKKVENLDKDSTLVDYLYAKIDGFNKPKMKMKVQDVLIHVYSHSIESAYYPENIKNKIKPKKGKPTIVLGDPIWLRNPTTGKQAAGFYHREDFQNGYIYIKTFEYGKEVIRKQPSKHLFMAFHLKGNS